MRIVFLVLLLLLATGCTTKQLSKKESWVVLIKSPKLRFNDVGYILQNGDNVELQLYSAGAAVEKFSVNHLICTESGCMRKSSFNEAYLNAAYDNDLLKDILMRRPIFDGKNLQKSKNGFEQHIVNGAYNITYRVTPKSLYFKDTTNRILFKLKRAR